MRPVEKQPPGEGVTAVCGEDIPGGEEAAPAPPEAPAGP